MASARQSGTPRIDVNVGDVRDAQLVIGDYTTVHTAKGTKVTVLQVGDRPVPRLRKLPISVLPPAGIQLVGREHELGLAATLAPDSPLQLCGREGVGKTALLKCIARAARPPADGVLFASVRRRDFDELRNQLYTAFWETDQPFLPSPAEVGDYLAGRDALVLLDDCGLDRDDLEAMLDSAPRCTFVVASDEQTLWSSGQAKLLAGLERAAGVALMDAVLGRGLDQDERGVAGEIVDQLGGHPQSLVEVASLVRAGTAGLRELASDPAAINTDTAALSTSQRRILQVLAAVDGATLGVEHVAAVARVPDAANELEALERAGWAKSQSPRYRLVRKFPADPLADDGTPVADRLLEHLTSWAAGKATPSDVSHNAEAIETTLHSALSAGRWKDALALAAATERKLAVAGSWRSSRRVLDSGLKAARAAESEPAEAQMLHQRGSLALCLGDPETATADLETALEIRERTGDADGAELTRHNLAQIEGAGGWDGGGSDSGDSGSGSGGRGDHGPRSPGLGTALAGVAIVAAVVAGALALTHKDSDTAGSAHSAATVKQPRQGHRKPPAKHRARDTVKPAIHIRSPRASEYALGARVVAGFNCSDRKSGVATCAGSVPDGHLVRTDKLGPLSFTVNATDRAGNKATRTVSYTVVDRTDPGVALDRPAEGAVYHQDDKVTAAYSCSDRGSGIATCSGPVATGGALDTSRPGDFEFTVTGTDRSGNKATRTAHYKVAEGTPPTIAITSPPDGSGYFQHTPVYAEYTCADEPGGSGVATCSGQVPSGGQLDTDTTGTHTFTVTATDNAGNSATKSVSYTVNYLG